MISLIGSRPTTPFTRSPHFPARACSTSLRFLPARSAVSLSAVHPNPWAARPLLPPLSSSNGRKIGGSKGELPLGGGGCGGGGSGSGSGGGRSGKPGSGDEDDRSGEVIRMLNWLLRRLLQLGVKGPLLAGDFLANMHSWISLSAEEMQTPYSNSTHEINEMGDEGSHFYGIDDKIKAIMRPHSDRSSRTSSNRNKYSTRTAEVGTRTTNSQDHSVDGDISDDETLLDDEKQMKAQSRQKKNQIRLQSRKKKNQTLQSQKKKRQRLQSRKKMEGTLSQVANTAASLFIGALALLPYWGSCCSDPTVNISKIWKDALFIAYIFLVIITIIVSGHSLRFKDAKLPDNAGFKLLEMVQLLLFLLFCVAIFIPQHVCRGVSIWAICPCIGVLFMIVMACATDFQKKTVMKCIEAPYQMVKCTKVMYEKVRLLLPNLSLPEYIKAKFKKMPEEPSNPDLPMGRV